MTHSDIIDFHSAGNCKYIIAIKFIINYKFLLLLAG